MAASDYDFQLTRNEIIERAMRIIGALKHGESLTAEMYDQARIALNSMVKSWQTQHIFLWTLKSLSLSITSGDVDYATSTDPPIIAIDRAYLVIDSQDVPMEVISYREYLDIPDKTTSSGDPTHIAIDYAESPTVYVYPEPNASRTLKYIGIAKLEDWDTAAGSADFPARFMDSLVSGLASSLAPEFGLPLAERRELERLETKHLMLAKRSDRERADYECVASAFPNRRGWV